MKWRPSLVAHKVFLFQDDASERVFNRSCAFIVNSGKRHQVLSQEPTLADNSEFGLVATMEPAEPLQAEPLQAEPNASTEPSASSAAPAAPTAASQITPYMNCIPHERHAKALKERYNEVPVVQALAEDDTVLEIYGSENSWTITQAKIREVRNTATGRPLTNEKTGQKIHQLCSDPAYSGKTWISVDH